jgi:hypothetical protein
MKVFVLKGEGMTQILQFFQKSNTTPPRFANKYVFVYLLASIRSVSNYQSCIHVKHQCFSIFDVFELHNYVLIAQNSNDLRLYKKILNGL